MFEILEKRSLNPTVTLMTISAPRVAKKAEPGQFIILRTDEKGERIVITIKADDSIQLNGMEMKKTDVISRVKELNAVKMRLPVLISGDRKSSLGVGIELLADLKAVGVEKASFQVAGEKCGNRGL